MGINEEENYLQSGSEEQGNPGRVDKDCRRKKKSTGTPCKMKLYPQWKATVLLVQEGKGEVQRGS